MVVSWNYFDKFDKVSDMYLPERGEGETKATQIVTAVTKLIYKYYNDGDVFDNTYHLKGWWNDLSSYANWLYENTEVENILDKISGCMFDGEYEDLLKELADKLFDENYLAEQNKEKKIGTVYECNGKFKFIEQTDDEDYYDDWEDEYEEEEEEEE